MSDSTPVSQPSPDMPPDGPAFFILVSHCLIQCTEKHARPSLDMHAVLDNPPFVEPNDSAGSVTNSDEYYSIPEFSTSEFSADTRRPFVEDDAMDVDVDPPPNESFTSDLLHSVHGMFRVLDLISEPGSAHALNSSRDDSEGPSLRSGLYLLRTFSLEPDTEQIFIIYWPEDTTWDDNATSSISRNRATFMRYLTKICDQVTCLISAKHAQSIAWSDDLQDVSTDADDKPSRLYKFQVAKTNEQEETVVTRAGFKITTSFSASDDARDHSIDPADLKPRLIAGETAQGLLTTKYVAAGTRTTPLRHETYNTTQLRKLIDVSFEFGPGISDNAIEDLMSLPFGVSQYKKCLDDWKSQKEAMSRRIAESARKDEADTVSKVTREMEEKKGAFRQVLIDRLLDRFPSIGQAALSTASDEERQQLRAQFSDLIKLYPSIGRDFEGVVRSHETDKVTPEAEFQTLKENLTFIEVFLEERHMSDSQREHAVTEMCASSGSLLSLPTTTWTKGSTGLIGTVVGMASYASWWMSFSHKPLQDQIQHIHIETERRVATRMDAEFLAGLDEMSGIATPLDKLASQAVLLVTDHLKTLVIKLSKTLVAKAIQGQQDVLKGQLQRSQVSALKEFSRRSLQTLRADMEKVTPSAAHAQIIESGDLLLVLQDPTNLLVYLDKPFNMYEAVARRRSRKTIFREKIGDKSLIAYNEQTRMLLICTPVKLTLHLFAFDETYGSLQAAPSLDLTTWYAEGMSIKHACFVCGSEEILVVDDINTARIFSLLPRQFRTVHLVGIDTGVCQSVGLEITKKTTEFMFKEAAAKSQPKTRHDTLTHNCLIDCHAEVWTRFPVVAAVQWQTIISSNNRLRRSLTFSTYSDHSKFAARFDNLIYAFEQRTRKPTGNELKRITISALEFSAATTLLSTHLKWEVSEFRAGEWLVDLLCLIPIQIAVTQENRFIPLKDGVVSATLEQQLLGAEVGQIVDALSIGWYESVFQSYMASKPVKVVSSMGEQSVGKSFSLNHLVDTSFAGSAMRTTEGVWMSVTPTDTALIVALDFEGTHILSSLYRAIGLRGHIACSVQYGNIKPCMSSDIFDRWTSFVLMKGQVLFRNNFAMSRSITGLFQSFQSSSTVLDPAANPQLFKSTLVIIIKDVVDSDEVEIVREFSTKFQKIVEDEQAANFISRLHAGQLNIIPWPVIESKQFYALFPALKKSLDQQEITHPAAGEFLHTLKTLMAKIKANDWGALSETLAAHRAQKLCAYLPSALTFGFYETEPTNEPLKNFDTDGLIEHPDSSFRFFISLSDISVEERQTMLVTLQKTWDQFDKRHQMPDVEWTAQLAKYLMDLAEMRIEQVFLWIQSNLSRFKSNHAWQTDISLDASLLSSKLSKVTSIVRSRSTAMKDICVPLLYTPVARLTHVHKPAQCRATTLIISTFATSSHVRYLVNSVRGCAPILIIFMASKRMLGTSAVVITLIDVRQQHNCNMLCTADGICQIDTTPQSIEATFVGRHETFQYTKLPNIYIVQLRFLPESSNILDAIFIAQNWPRFISVKRGHSQQQHETSHSSMSKTTWAIDGPNDAVLELKGRKFASSHDGAPMMCNLICQDIGRHVHIDYCRAVEDAPCDGPEIEHIHPALTPNPERSKDWISHSLFWKRTGFKGPEHAEANPLSPSYCSLPIFHPTARAGQGAVQVAGAQGYTSNDGHIYTCKNPAEMRPAYHVIFVIDKSSSMAGDDLHPLPNRPGAALITCHADNRLGAVFSALHAFWMSRSSALDPGIVGARKDAYSVVFFDGVTSTCLQNDRDSTPDDLLTAVLQYTPGGWTNSRAALSAAETLMRDHWNNDLAPVVIFLSDGECNAAQDMTESLARTALDLGHPLSFHSVLFGDNDGRESLQSMAQSALEIQNGAPNNAAQRLTVSSSFSEALDEVCFMWCFAGPVLTRL
ncbi:hypothetical protein B0H10DRAFT_1945867 [Mycena sp. CBHHK59/15]|nr:hypothetical protein B0H10DRAFT_1945867 [Mycena sp. CBHHK59/15]